ncbi:DUF4145 domain-containing protein [Mycobacteroides abscessus]|uniref:DUF4145 domain-containing protein n=1 Tax=Mycobacteroides abscessus TaxID=36809 RepID=UPI0012FFFF71|nr:DUF4145 domain-containing protein [Mycobacteroides abscessus]
MGFTNRMAMRTCAYCGLKRAQMNVVLRGQVAVRSDYTQTHHSVVQCPDCTNLTIIQHTGPNEGPGVIRVFPSDDDTAHSIRHLPERVEQYYNDALRVLDAGVPDAAAVQLRRTLEAAAAEFNVGERTLFKSIEKLIELGYVTTQFRSALNHVRAVGNLGAHASDERVDDVKAQHALSFTTQLLRNLFEVPGDLLLIAADADDVAGDTNDEDLEQ